MSEILNTANSGWLALGVGLLLSIASLARHRRGRQPDAATLRALLEQAHREPDPRHCLTLCLQALSAEVGAVGAYLLVQDPEQPTLLRQLMKVGDLSAPEVLSVDVGLSGQAFSNAQAVAVRGSGATPLREEFVDQFSSVMSVPLLAVDGQGSKKPIGVVTLASKQGKPFGPSHLKAGMVYATLLSLLVGNEQMLKFARSTVLDVITEIADLLDAKDIYTAGHARRTSAIATAIARNLGLEDSVCQELEMGVPLLDIGKVAIPDTILQKRSGLTEDEFAVVRSHVEVSYQLCQRLRLPESILLLVRNHHERIDGSGYPDGLRGSELPLALRIVSVADAYDAMRCARPHRDQLSHDEAIAALRYDAGSKLDSTVVEILNELASEPEFEDLYRADDLGLRAA